MVFRETDTSGGTVLITPKGATYTVVDTAPSGATTTTKTTYAKGTTPSVTTTVTPPKVIASLPPPVEKPSTLILPSPIQKIITQAGLKPPVTTVTLASGETMPKSDFDKLPSPVQYTLLHGTVTPAPSPVTTTPKVIQIGEKGKGPVLPTTQRPDLLIWGPTTLLAKPGGGYQMLQTIMGKIPITEQIYEKGVAIKPVAPLESKTYFGYSPPESQYAYQQAIQKTSDNVTNLVNYVNQARQFEAGYSKYQKDISSQINMVQSGDPTTTWVLGGKNYSQKEALDYLRGEQERSQNIHNVLIGKTPGTNDMISIPQATKDIRTLIEQKGTLQQYQQAGYKIIETDKGYSFSTPKATEVVKGYYGDRPDLYTAQAMRSLGVQYIGAGIQQLVTGQQSLEALKESEAQSILGSSKRIGESAEAYTQRFWTSPEVIAEVYVPIATFGVFKGVSLLGKAIAPTVSELIGGSKVATTIIGGAKTLLKPIGEFAVEHPIISKAGIKYGLYGVQAGPGLIETAQKQPESVGGQFAKSLYGWEITWGMMEAGLGKSNLFESKSQKALKQEFSERFAPTPETVQQQVAMSDINIWQKGIEGKGGPQGISIFRTGEGGKVIVENIPMKAGEKPLVIDVSARGITENVEVIMGKQGTISEGYALLKYTEKGPLGLGEKTYYTMRKIGSSAEEMPGLIPGRRTVYSEEWMEGRLEPTTGQTLTNIDELLRIQKPSLIVEKYAGTGEYSNIIENLMGKTQTKGQIFTIGKTGKAVDEWGLLESGKSIEEEALGKQYYFGQELAPQELVKPTVEKIIKPSLTTPSATGIETSILKEAGIFAKEIQAQTKFLTGVGLGATELVGAGLGVSAISKAGEYYAKPSVAVMGGMESLTKQELRSITETGIKPISILEPEKESRIFIEGAGKEIGEISRREVDILPDIGRELEQPQKEGLAPLTGLASISESTQLKDVKAISEGITLTTLKGIPISFFKGGFTPPPPPPPVFFKKKKDEAEQWGTKYYKGEELMTTRKGKRKPKGLPPDLLSATISQARYGKSTAPKVTEKLFKESGKGLFLRTPTVELMKGNKNRNYMGSKKTKGGTKKNAYY